jgi:general secretion pathway protein D
MKMVWTVAVLAAWNVAMVGQETRGEKQDSAAPTPVVTSAGATNQLSLNFRGAPLDLVLDYLSEAAGFVINKQTDVHGTIDIWSKEPVTRQEAVELLNAALKKNGSAVVRQGRLLTVLAADAAKTADLEVVSGSQPEAVERSAELVTQVIPVRHANATQLVNNLQPLLPLSATLTANESANSLILIASKTDVRRMLRIISALDGSISGVSAVAVIPLKHADAKALASAVQQIFPSSNSGQRSGNSFPTPFGPPGFNSPFGNPDQAANQSGNNVTTAKVAAVADEPSNSLIVTAPPSFLATITNMVAQIDQPVMDMTELRLFQLKHADPGDLADQIGQVFPDTANTSSGAQGGFRFGGPGGFPGGQFGGPPGSDQAQSSPSDRQKKQGRVIAVADPRTSSLLVSAAANLMPQIVRMVEQLDSDPSRKESVHVFDLRNADPTAINQALQDLFARNTAQRNNNNQNGLLGNNNPLTTRQTQQQNQTQAPGGNFGAGGLGGAPGGTASP